YVSTVNHREVFAGHGGVQEHLGGALAPAAVDIAGLVADATAEGTVGVVHPGKARLLGGGEEGLAQPPGVGVGLRHRVAGDLQGAAHTPLRAGAELVILVGHEVGQHVRPAPAGATELGPAVVVVGKAPGIDHAVDAAGAADGAALEPGFLAPVGALVDLEGPHMGIARRQQLADAPGHCDEKAAVHGAALDHQHPVGGIAGQFGGQHATGGARPHDAVVCVDDHGHFLELSLLSDGSVGRALPPGWAAYARFQLVPSRLSSSTMPAARSWSRMASARVNSRFFLAAARSAINCSMAASSSSWSPPLPPLR